MNNTLAAKFTWLPGFCDQRWLPADALFEMLLGNGMKANAAAVDTRSAGQDTTVGGCQATDGRLPTGKGPGNYRRRRRRGLSFVLDGTTAIQWTHERNRTEETEAASI